MNRTDLAEEYSQRLEALTDDDFIASFNREVGCNAWGYARSLYLCAIREEFQKRQLDYSAVGTERGISYKYVVFLKGKTLCRLSDLPESEVVVLFAEFMRNYPEMVKLKPVIVNYDNDSIRFSITGNTGLLAMESNDLVKNKPGQSFRSCDGNMS